MGVQDLPPPTGGHLGYPGPSAIYPQAPAQQQHPYQQTSQYAASYAQPPYGYPAPNAQQQYQYQHPSSHAPAPAPAGHAQHGPSASGVEVVDLTSDLPPSKKRKGRESAPAYGSTDGDVQWLSEPPKKRKAAVKDGVPTKAPTKRRKKGVDEEDHSMPKKAQKKSKPAQDEEKRLKKHRAKAPQAYLQVRERALTQRMFALSRERDTTNPEHPIETISLAGTTGNVYTIVVDKVPSCDCPHAIKGNQCKHIAYVMSRVLRAPAHLEYQLALLSSELCEIFEKAPPLPSETAEKDDDQDGNRKPIEGECPICCVDFEPESKEEIVYCKAACGNNIHKDCFKQWAATKTTGQVPCPFCRTPWQSDDPTLKGLPKGAKKNQEGYVNVASQLGMSGRRDYSSYHSYWVRDQVRRGEVGWDDDGVMEHEFLGGWR